MRHSDQYNSNTRADGTFYLPVHPFPGRSEHDEQSWLNTDTPGEGQYLQHFLLTLIVLFMLEWQEVEMK